MGSPRSSDKKNQVYFLARYLCGNNFSYQTETIICSQSWKVGKQEIALKNKPVVSVKVISLLMLLKIKLQLSVMQLSDKTSFDGFFYLNLMICKLFRAKNDFQLNPEPDYWLGFAYCCTLATIGST